MTYGHTPALQKIFSPYVLSEKLRLKNRIVMSPMSRNFSFDHIPTEAVAEYYKRRAEGGVALIITESTAINHPAAQGAKAHGGGAKAAPGLASPAAIAAWQRVVDGVHAADVPIFLQLWHVGSVRDPSDSFNPEVPAMGPSAIKHPRFAEGEGCVPHAMSRQDIQAVIASYAEAASIAKSLGFNGVELNGAHGYGIDQFFWEATNQRDDEYGGKTLGERTRFAADVVRAIKTAVGKDFVVSFRFSQWKVNAYQIQLAHNKQELSEWLLPLKTAGVDIFHASTQTFNAPAFATGSESLAELTKTLTGKTTIAVGGVGLNASFEQSFTQNAVGESVSLLPLSDFFAREACDLIAAGRVLIANPNWPKLIAAGDWRSIKPFDRSMIAELF
jgi:2,4-dienoyl-CoA reductase-like NADH-dependent reductase (Old Yellow Enzyme family)